jgi:hypothetical protein
MDIIATDLMIWLHLARDITSLGLEIEGIAYGPQS